MASTAEIKSRIDSIMETRKITNAMYLIASTKLRRARSELEQTRPYFAALRSEIKRVFRTANDVDSHYFYPPDQEPEMPGTYGCLVITADKGLAGAYNQNVLKKAQRLLEAHSDTKLFVVGEYGRRFFTQHHVPIEQMFLYTAQNPTLDRAREISSLLLDQYDRGLLKKIFVIYTDMENGLTARVRSTRLLPFHRTYFAPPEKEKKIMVPFEFEPSVSAVLNGMMHSYLTGFIYSALIDSFCSEQQARMTAMDSANRNAEELLADLSLQYNRVRQAAITQEITEVTAGAKAQRKKRRKKEVQVS
ncbi:ATP synthase F1 subunit gamma [Pseudoflavonifractor sp. AF19-9AC]|uniref:ATP synthase F1 subunit gamma n=1 Tax=Pseudoflavonifractor sp. AF19-9AC TaxID=2292244 RepID=UPI000E4B2C9D|nr:ATP synthase F1 subunit gamma [Pseudoflavonifractor sp. AF19-9AC]RHR08831.1 ATP synthase F1 subunit gamma [Pseudoflavonifractor sp. AF19-9AC]